MKAFKSSLARQALADPKAREQLRKFTEAPTSQLSASGVRIELQVGGRRMVLQPVTVPTRS